MARARFRSKSLSAMVCVALLAFGLPAPASLAAEAEKQTTKAADPKVEAQEIFALGNQLAGDGDYVTALERFREAYALFASPKILINIGTTLRQLGRNAEAASVYEAALRDPAVDPARRKDVERALAEIDQIVGVMSVRVEPEGAAVRFDGQPLPKDKRGPSFRVDAGTHTVIAERPGMLTVARTVDVVPRQTYTIVIKLMPPGKAPKPVVVVQAPGRTQRIVGAGIGALGLAGIATGTIFAVLGVQRNDEASLYCYRGGPACTEQGVSLGADARALRFRSSIAYGAGGAALLAGLLVFVTAPSGKSSTEEKVPRIGFSPLPLGGMVTLTGGL